MEPKLHPEKKLWTTPQAQRFGTFAEATRRPQGNPVGKTVGGTDAFCLLPDEATQMGRGNACPS